MTSTGKDGFTFLKLDCGMTEILRPSLYGAQHPISVVPAIDRKEEGRCQVSCLATGDSSIRGPDSVVNYVVVGHCCESGDLLSCAQDSSDAIAPRPCLKAGIGDLCIIDGTGAYCSSMSAKNYNSFPEAAEVLLTEGYVLILKLVTWLRHLTDPTVSSNSRSSENASCLSSCGKTKYHLTFKL